MGGVELSGYKLNLVKHDSCVLVQTKKETYINQLLFTISCIFLDSQKLVRYHCKANAIVTFVWLSHVMDGFLQKK